MICVIIGANEHAAFINALSKITIISKKTSKEYMFDLLFQCASNKPGC